MNIGVDIDNVISDYDNCFIQECLQHDKTLRNSGIINKNAADILNGMFDWTPEEAASFYRNNAERIAANLTTVPHSKEYIDRLKADGHKIIIITARDDGTWCNPHTLTRTWLSNNHTMERHLYHAIIQKDGPKVPNSDWTRVILTL